MSRVDKALTELKIEYTKTNIFNGFYGVTFTFAKKPTPTQMTKLKALDIEPRKNYSTKKWELTLYNGY